MNAFASATFKTGNYKERWHSFIESGKAQFSKGAPFPFLIIDDFLTQDDALAASQNFPSSNGHNWVNYTHVNEKKFGLSKREFIPTAILNIIGELESEQFLKTLSSITGINNLIADETLAGGGLHQTYPGGFLNIHSDFLIHPVKRNLMRRINLILFLSHDWQQDYGGELEFWNKDMTECVTRIQPKFNRCVIFITDEFSYHGCPEKLRGPAEFSRKSLALYYYTEYNQAPKKQFTDYKPRPQDANRKLAIYLDNKAVSAYSWLKHRLNLNDDFISRILKFLNSIRH